MIEDFKADFQRLGAGRFHDMETPKIIGCLQYWAHRMGVPGIFLQQPSIKPAGYGFAGLKYVKGRQGTHRQDAIAHLAYFVRQTWPRVEDAVEAELARRRERSAGRKAHNPLGSGDVSSF